MYPNTRRLYNDNGSGQIEYNQQNPENFFNSNEIPKPKYIGGIGDTCDNDNSQCHADLYCYSKTCSHWSPYNIPFKNKSVIVQRSSEANLQLCTYKEDCKGGWVCVNQTCQLPVGVKEGFGGIQNFGPKKGQVKYTTHHQNSGRNYYLYDETR